VKLPPIAIPLMLVALPMFYVSPSRNSKEYVEGTVVGVESRQVESPVFTVGGSNPSDAPLASRYYVYEVSIRVGCETYVGRYETPFHYLPSAFAPAQRLEFRLTKRVMYFEIPYSDGIRMGIVRRHRECGANR
jgi:hypothetical protein